MTDFYDWVPSISEILNITAVTRPFSELLFFSDKSRCCNNTCDIIIIRCLWTNFNKHNQHAFSYVDLYFHSNWLMFVTGTQENKSIFLQTQKIYITRNRKRRRVTAKPAR